MLKNIIKRIIPSWLLVKYYGIKDKRSIKKKIKRCERMHRQTLSNVNQEFRRRPLRCVFFGLFDSIWKFDSVYNRMEKDSRFEPIILVCPVVNYGYENMIRTMDECYKSFSKKGYNVVKSYNKETGEYIDFRKELYPDIIIYTNPYKGLIDDRYYVTNCEDILTVYVHYGFNSAKAWDMLYHQFLTNAVWRYYVESEIHQEYVKRFSFNKGRNSVVTGYPGIEELISPDYVIKSNPWISERKTKKRIIWAPHHTIEPVGIINFSNFLRDADYMLEMATKYREQIEIAFKPHPLLRNKLYKKWGAERTEYYYHQWEIMDNTFLAEGEYIDLFLTSDAMIHDSGSFLIEYLYVDKPVMRVMTEEDMTKVLNSFALSCLNYYYKAYSQCEIEKFIQNIIIGADPLKISRTKFVRDFLMPKGGMPSENIINDIIDSIEHQRV